MMTRMSRYNYTHRSLIAVCIFLFLPGMLMAQDAAGDGGADYFATNMEYIVIGLLILIFTILVFGILTFGDRLVKVSVKELAVDTGNDAELLQDQFKLTPKLLPTIKRSTKKVIQLKQGHDITIKGKAPLNVADTYHPASYGLKPSDFMGLSPIPKVMVEEGQTVKAGDPIFFDKKRPEIIYTAPISGEFVELRRGEQRRIEELVFVADKEVQFKDFGTVDPNTLSREDIIDRMLNSGVWPFVRQRPFNIVADPKDTPKMIYISCFNTAPLATDLDFAVQGQEAAFQAGVDALGKLTDGGVHLGMNAKKKHSAVFIDAQGVTHHWFSGPHPAGNVGVQIHHVNPVNKGEVVWTLQAQDVVILGRLFTEGHYNTSRVVSINGPEVKNPTYVRAYIGAAVEKLLENNLDSDHVRVISGDVLTGTKISNNGFLGFYDDSLSVILEGDEYEMFGWLLPSYPRPTVSPTFLSYFFAGEELRVNTNTHGEERPFVVTGLYEELLPMDIYLMQLLKAIMVEDFEQMEGLGIYEIDESDIAICEFACPSKTPMQQILRKGLDMVRAEG